MISAKDEPEGLRQHSLSKTGLSAEEARRTVLKLNAEEDQSVKNEKDKKTYGRTPNGTVFIVPATHDMLTHLLSPSDPKNASDFLVLLVLFLHFVLIMALPSPLNANVMGIVFVFWRTSYNIGVGWLLNMQSRQQTIVRWARKSRLFGEANECNRPRLRAFFKHEFETKIPRDYHFDTAPLEFNAWLVFRRLCDLILTCDFMSWLFFALACSHQPVGESLLLTLCRWTVGAMVITFSIWAKVDAHRVVTNYAWYWGDFFFSIDRELTFDGVFEMAPHPMYSLGYVGYYGMTIITASYKVLFISVLAHAMMFGFLIWVENPHIERTYNSPPPKHQIHEAPKATAGRQTLARTQTATIWPSPSFQQPPATHDLLGLQNLDLYRTVDTSVILLIFFLFALTMLTPNTPSYQVLFVLHAVTWRLWFSVGIGYLLNRQSHKKKWTRHYLKYGESTGEAWRQWKGTYHLSMVLCYTSFIAAAWKMYDPPRDWTQGYVLPAHITGFSLVALQIWVSFSIYDSLGEFGWFYGDFFYDHSPKLIYSGIYRFLNNPERVLGLAGVWGIALITNSKAIYSLALLSHFISLAFIHFVERPHMEKLYGRNIRQDAGLVRYMRRSLPSSLADWQDTIDKTLGEIFDTVELFVDAIGPSLAVTLERLVEYRKHFFAKYSGRIGVSQLEISSAGLNPDDYVIEIANETGTNRKGSRSPLSDTIIRSGSSIEGKDNNRTLVIDYGVPIKVKWTAPLNHDKLDWIGIYKVSDNESRETTNIFSSSQWIATNPGEYDTAWAEFGILQSDVESSHRSPDGQELKCVTGEMAFSGDKLWWSEGLFEFRYHHNGKYRVMATSEPFEIRITPFCLDKLANDLQDSPDTQRAATVRHSIEKKLLPVVQNCFDRDPEIAPDTPQETFGGLVERDGKFSKRVVYAIHHAFGIEFAQEVVKADGNVENLAWRIQEAMKVLEPAYPTRYQTDISLQQESKKEV